MSPVRPGGVWTMGPLPWGKPSGCAQSTPPWLCLSVRRVRGLGRAVRGQGRHPSPTGLVRSWRPRPASSPRLIPPHLLLTVPRPSRPLSPSPPSPEGWGSGHEAPPQPGRPLPQQAPVRIAPLSASQPACSVSTPPRGRGPAGVTAMCRRPQAPETTTSGLCPRSLASVPNAPVALGSRARPHRVSPGGPLPGSHCLPPEGERVLSSKVVVFSGL